MSISCPTAEQVRVRAYQIFLERGCQPGHEIDDWLQAEYELMHVPASRIVEHDAEAEERATPCNLRLVGLLTAIAPLKEGRKRMASRG
jgi:hypothetical protein